MSVAAVASDSRGDTVRDETIGSLNLYSDRVGPMPSADTTIARALTDVATISILQERALRESDVARDQLQRALDSRVLTEQAKGVLPHLEQIEMDEAFTLLRRRARSSGRRLSVVAQHIIDGAIAGRGTYVVKTCWVRGAHARSFRNGHSTVC